MRRTIKVFLGEGLQEVGTIRYDSQKTRESAVFEYNNLWLTSTDRFAIEPGLPLVTGQQFHHKSQKGSVFHNAIADTEPDGWARHVILRAHARRRLENPQTSNQINTLPLNSLDFLLAVDDFSRVGALRFQDENSIFQCAPEEGDHRAPPLIELSHLLAATRAVETNTETGADLAYLRGRGTSLGGMRPKCTVVDDKGNLSIGKFPSISDERAVTKGEVLALNLARLAGIRAAQAKLIISDNLPVTLIQRFDRFAGGGRIMYVSAATLMGLDPTEPGEHTYTEIVDAIRIHGAAAQQDIEELWRRLAFSILITNIDDHLLNHGFLHVEQGKWRLAPAFDLNPLPDKARELKTWISEQAGPHATIDALFSVTPYFRIPHTRAKKILKDVERAVSNWKKVGRALGMTNRELAQFSPAFEHSERLEAKKVL